MMSQKKNDIDIPNYYLYGTVLTRYGLASLNHDMRRGNKTILQKGYWNGKIHSFVGSSAIRWALRFYLQQQGYLVNRVWHEDESINRLTSEDFDPEEFYDDDIFGFALLESTETEEETSTTKRKKKQTKSGTFNQRMGALAMNMAVSLTPYDGAVKLGAKSGREKDSTSLYFTEYHATRYQYYFGINATHLRDFSRILPLIDGIINEPSSVKGFHLCCDSWLYAVRRCSVLQPLGNGPKTNCDSWLYAVRRCSGKVEEVTILPDGSDSWLYAVRRCSKRSHSKN